MNFQTFCARRNLLNRSGSRCCMMCPLRTRPLRETCAVDQPTYCPHVDHSMFHSPASVDPLREATLLPRVEVIFGDRRAHQQGEERSGESENGIRPRNISSRKRLLPGFKPSIGLLDPGGPSAVDEGLPFVPRVLLVIVSIAMTLGLGNVQAASQSAIVSSSTTAHDGPGDNQSTSLQGPSDQASTSPCRLQVQDPLPQPSAKATEATATIGTLDYTPLSSRCKFNLFLQQTHSPYTFVAAGFEATWAQAMGQWPHYGGGTQGWAKRFGATQADTESRRFIQIYALSTILHQDPRYFPSRKRILMARVWYSTTRVIITRNDNGKCVFNTSEFLGTLLSSAPQNAYYPRHDRTLGGHHESLRWCAELGCDHGSSARIRAGYEASLPEACAEENPEDRTEASYLS